MGVTPLSAAPLLLPFVLSQLQLEHLPETLPPSPPPVTWLDGQASLVGGQYSSSEMQHDYAEMRQLKFLASETEYNNQIATGGLVRLSGPYLNSIARRPYVLPSTFRFVETLAREYYNAGCGRLVITSASRLVNERPRNGSIFSVHPVGMAVDVRVNGIGEACETWLNTYLLEKEALGEVDATREFRPPHYHLVVPVEVIRSSVQIAQIAIPTPNQSD